MKTLLIDIKSESDFAFLSSLIKKLGYKSRIISREEKENLGLLKAMKESEGDDILTFQEAKAVYKTMKKAH